MPGSDTLPAAVGTLAAAMAQGRTAEDIALLSAIFVQLGDSLALIAAARALGSS